MARSAVSILTFAVLGFLFDVLSFTMPGWTRDYEASLGLWYACEGFGECHLIDSYYIHMDWKFRCLQGAQTFGVVTYLGALITAFIYACSSSYDKRVIAKVLIFLSTLSLISTVAGIVMFSSIAKAEMYYCFGLNIAASILCLLVIAKSLTVLWRKEEDEIR